MKRFLIFLLCILFVLGAFILLGFLFKEIGLIIFIVLLLLFALVYFSWSITATILIRRLKVDLVFGRFLHVIKMAPRLIRGTFSKDEHLEIFIALAFSYLALNQKEQFIKYDDKIHRSDARCSNDLQLLLDYELFKSLALLDKQSYEETVIYLTSISEKLTTSYLENIRIGRQILAVKDNHFSKFEDDEIMSIIKKRGEQPLFIADFFNFYEALSKDQRLIHDHISSFQTPIFNALFFELRR